MRDKIVSFIADLSNEANIDHSLDLFESGHLSSLDILSLFSFMESTFSITIDDDDMSVDNFGSIDNIVKYLEKAQS